MWQFTELFLIVIGSLKEAEQSNATVAAVGIFTKTNTVFHVSELEHQITFL